MNFSHSSKDAQENSTSFDTNVVLEGGGANMGLNEKPTKNGNHVYLNCVGLGRIK